MRTAETTAETTIDQLEQLLVRAESHIAQLRARQMATLHALDLAQVPLMDGARNLAEWAASRMDLTADTSRQLVETARRLQDQPDLAQDLKKGSVSFERVVEESRLVAAGAAPELLARARGWDLAGLRRMTARQRRISRRDEQRLFEERFLSIQPTLDRTSYKLWGQFSGSDGRIIEQALTHRSDQFPPLPDGGRCPQAQSRADALVSIAQDSLNGSQPEGSPAAPVVSVFVDAHESARSNGEAGAEIDVGPRVGPLTLEEILCDGRAEILVTAQNGKPLSVGPTARTIPPKLRRFILHRVGGACTADGCRSRYRLQPHHIRPRSHGGTHDPDNLTTLCSFHHHVVIHRNGFRIDPDSPPQRRRFLHPNNHDPP